jgi:hypothetical protein
MTPPSVDVHRSYENRERLAMWISAAGDGVLLMPGEVSGTTIEA